MCRFPHMLIHFCGCFGFSSNFHFVLFFMAYWSRTQCTSTNQQKNVFQKEAFGCFILFCLVNGIRACMCAKQFIRFFFEANWISNIKHLLEWTSEIHERELRFFNLSSSQLCQQKCDFVTKQIINELLNAIVFKETEIILFYLPYFCYNRVSLSTLRTESDFEDKSREEKFQEDEC